MQVAGRAIPAAVLSAVQIQAQVARRGAVVVVVARLALGGNDGTADERAVLVVAGVAGHHFASGLTQGKDASACSVGNGGCAARVAGAAVVVMDVEAACVLEVLVGLPVAVVVDEVAGLDVPRARHCGTFGAGAVRGADHGARVPAGAVARGADGSEVCEILVGLPVAVVVEAVAHFVSLRGDGRRADRGPRRIRLVADVDARRPAAALGHLARLVLVGPEGILVHLPVAVVVEPVAGLGLRLPRHGGAHRRAHGILGVADHHTERQAPALAGAAELPLVGPQVFLVGVPVAVVVQVVADLDVFLRALVLPGPGPAAVASDRRERRQ